VIDPVREALEDYCTVQLGDDKFVLDDLCAEQVAARDALLSPRRDRKAVLGFDMTLISCLAIPLGSLGTIHWNMSHPTGEL
jgi:hypothetical protein